MLTLLQINTIINSGSTGHIAEELGKLVIANGWESYIAYGRNPRPSASKSIRIGFKCGVYFHVILTRLFDRHGFASYFTTKKFIRQVKKIKPSIIHLHNIHGYYLNIKVLFDYLKTLDIPIIWTLHDCWAFTGHCTHYIAVRCGKWQDSCQDCPQKKRYPKSFVDNSKSNFLKKKAVFTGVKNLTIVTPSVWLSEQVKKSFLSVYSAKTIYNGIDLNVFAPAKKYPTGISAALKSKKIILGVASVWDERKGLADFIKLAKLLSDDEAIVLVGLSRKQIALLPNNIVGIERTENQAELVQWYSVSTVFFNPTYEDTFPTTNLEAFACGTPVVTYRTGGSPEAVDERTGFVIAPGDVEAAVECIRKIEDTGKSAYQEHCVERVKKLYDKSRNFLKYLEIYDNAILGK